jgi:cytoskeletal protein CcmA (bactofilin family)
MAWIRQKSEPEPTVTKSAHPAEPAAPQAPRQEESKMSMVNIGKTIKIKGEIVGQEDLTIEGHVDGKITLRDHHLSVGANGRLTAEVTAKSVSVTGEVVGNITATDKVEVAATGSMKGDICAPRVILADGARFKGSIDMAPQNASKAAQPQSSSSSNPSKSSAGSSTGMSQTAAASK